MNDYLEYKGYLGTVEYSAIDDLLCGEVAGIRGLIMYHGDNISDLKKDFENAVNHYLSCCKEEGMSPQLPCYGTLSVEISPAVHKQLQIYTLHNGKTQNEAVEDALRLYMTA